MRIQNLQHMKAELKLKFIYKLLGFQPTPVTNSVHHIIKFSCESTAYKKQQKHCRCRNKAQLDTGADGSGSKLPTGESLR